MIIRKDSEWVVMDTNTKEVISRHPFKPNSDYEAMKAKKEALASNHAWKSNQ